MHNDEVIWQVLGCNFCSFKAKVLDNAFCRNPYNVTGQCNRVSCPLSNGYYATVIEDEGQCYLCLKTIERAHLPNKMWEKIKLSNNFQEALRQIEIHMKNIYKDHQIHRCKQRLTRLRQTLITMRKMQLTSQTTVVPLKKKTERREATREKKAETAAKLEISIEQELLNRLKQGVYGDIYNYDKEAFQELLDEKEALEEDAETESNLEFIEDSDDLEEEDEIEADEERLEQLREELEMSDIEDLKIENNNNNNKRKAISSSNDVETKKQKMENDRELTRIVNRTNKKKEILFNDRDPRIEIEYEYENDQESH